MIDDFQQAFRSMRQGLDVLYVREGVKPVARVLVHDDQLGVIKIFLSKHSLHFTLANFKLQETLHPSRAIADKAVKISPLTKKGRNVLYISLNQELVMKAKQAEAGDDHAALGKLLGYPECCINFFVEHFPFESKRFNDYTLATFQCSDGLHFPFFVNYSLRHLDLGLINHFPCNFNCEGSVALAKQHLDVIKKFDKDVARIQEEMLKGVVVYTETNGIFLLRNPSFTGKKFSFRTIMASTNNELYEKLKTSGLLEVVDKHHLKVDGELVGDKRTAVLVFS